MDLKKYLADQAATAQDAVTQYDTDVVAATDAGKVDGDAAGYERGKADGILIGRDQMVTPDPADPANQYTQEQVNQITNDAVAAAVAPIQLQVDERQAALEAAQKDTEAAQKEVEEVKASIEDEKAAAVTAAKAELLAKYQEQQVVESQEETGFADLLK